MKATFKFTTTDIETCCLAAFDAFLESHTTSNREPEPGSLHVLAPRRPGAETLGLCDPQVRALYAALTTRFPRLPRWVAAGKFSRELILTGITGLRVSWDDDGDCPHYSYTGAAEAARWAQVEALAFPEIAAGDVVTPEIEEQWRDLHREF